MFHPFQLFVVLNRLRHSLKSSRTLQCYLTRTFSFSTTQGILWLFRTLSQLIFRKQEWCKKFFPLLSVHVNKTHVTGMTKTNFLNSILKKKKKISAVKLTITFFFAGEKCHYGANWSQQFDIFFNGLFNSFLVSTGGAVCFVCRPWRHLITLLIFSSFPFLERKKRRMICSSWLLGSYEASYKERSKSLGEGLRKPIANTDFVI